MADKTKYTVQEILNRCFDSTNNLLYTSGTNVGEPPTKYRVQHILNRVFDATNNCLCITSNPRPNPVTYHTEQAIWNNVFSSNGQYISISTNSTPNPDTLGNIQEIANNSFDISINGFAVTTHTNGLPDTYYSLQEILNLMFDPINNTLNLFTPLAYSPTFYLKSTSPNSNVFSDGAVQFTAADKSHLTITEAAQTGLCPTTGNFSLSFWVYPDDLNDCTLISKGSASASGAPGYVIRLATSGKVAVLCSDNTTRVSSTSSSALTQSAWNHVTVTFDRAGNATTYINTISKATVDISARSGDWTNASAFFVGSEGSAGTFLNGRIDSLGLWSKVLSTAEIASLYNSGRGQTYSDLDSTEQTNLTSWYGFNEENGTRYDAKGSNHLSQAFVDIISPTLLNGGFETAGTNVGTVSNVPTSTVVRLTNVVTVVTSINHGLSSTNVVTITGFTDSTLNATSVAVTVVNATTFSYTKAGSDVTLVADTGGRVTTAIFGTWSFLANAVTGSLASVNSATPLVGTYSLTLTGVTSGYISATQTVMTIGKKYKITLLAKAASGTPSYSLRDVGGGTTYITQATTTSAVTYTHYITASSTTLSLVIASAGVIDFDTFTVTSSEIQSNTGIAAGLTTDGNLCASFNGSSQYLSVASNATLQSGNFDFEVGCWVNLNSKAALAIFMIKGTNPVNANTTEYSLYYSASDDRFRFVTSDGSTATLPATADVLGSPSVNTWYFIRGWYTSADNTAHISINNGTANTQVEGYTPTATNLALNIGASTTAAQYTNGRMDGSYFIKRVLTTGEATAMFNNGKGVKYAGLPSTVSADATLSFWNLDMYSAGTGAVTRTDSTANANNLTDNGTTPSGQGVAYFEGAVSKWVDSSANANNFIQTTQANKPLYRTNQINSLPVLTFDALTKRLLNAADEIGTGDITLAMVIKGRSAGGAGAGRLVDNGPFISYYTANQVFINGGSSAANAVPFGTPTVVIATITSAGVVNIFVNGTLSGAADQAGTARSAGSPTYIGNNGSANRGYDGDIATLSIYQSILTAAQISSLNAYLRGVYNI